MKEDDYINFGQGELEEVKQIPRLAEGKERTLWSVSGGRWSKTSSRSPTI
jgi:hypothetical protein